MKNDNYHLGQLNGPVSQIDIQRNMPGWFCHGRSHILDICSIYRALICIIESVDSISRDGPDMPYM